MATKGAHGRGKKDEGLVLLKNLVPRKDPKGGAAKAVFGEPELIPGPNAPERAGRRPGPRKK